jgi:hypothetical protein
MKARIEISISHDFSELDAETRRAAELSMAGFREALEAVIAAKLERDCPDVALIFEGFEDAE